jgi:hypothetical protein
VGQIRQKPGETWTAATGVDDDRPIKEGAPFECMTDAPTADVAAGSVAAAFSGKRKPTPVR